MTLYELNKRIAKFKGVNYLSWRYVIEVPGKNNVTQPSNVNGFIRERLTELLASSEKFEAEEIERPECVPNYSGDLNLMFEVEEQIPEQDLKFYENHLKTIQGFQDVENYINNDNKDVCQPRPKSHISAKVRATAYATMYKLASIEEAQSLFKHYEIKSI